ncbi:MAG: phenylalanine--tRNA ligase subunit beta [Acidimicrobiales bacterium]
MRVLLSVLREMADLPGDPGTVADAMNRLGMAVESVEHTGAPVSGVVTARIVRTEKHPDAAKVTRCWVDAGDGSERHVWCGATNMGPGDVVPLATIGTRMPDGREISRRGILGIDSEGMLCSPVEIGITDEASGLLILPAGTAIGVDPFSVLGIEPDMVFVLDLTRNRPDCWGHLGIARDLAAHFGCAVRGPHVVQVATGDPVDVPVTITAGERCGMFSAVAVSGVRVGPSPAWVAGRLSRMGMRPINNVVDASNLVMLELNQPNHAYDLDVVGGFDVRLASEGEHLVTLDGNERVLGVDDLLICNASSAEPVGLAGIMGGLNSEVTDATTRLALEVAWFTPDPVRFSVNRLNLRSEASVRFERGVDPGGVALAIRRFVTILSETCPGVTLHGDGTRIETESLPRPGSFHVRTERVRRSLGIAPDGARMAELLAPLGFIVVPDGSGASVTAPGWRPDCTEEIDIVEEIARHHGYDALGKSVPKSAVHGHLTRMQQRRRDLRRVLVGLGLDEVMPMPFLAPGDLGAVGLDGSQHLRIANPLVAEESVLRTSLRPGLLRTVRYNQSHRSQRISLFEIGHVYPPGKGQLPEEAEHLGVMMSGADVSAALAVWSEVGDALSVGAQLDQSRIPAGLHPTRSAALARGKRIIGAVGEVHPEVLDHLGIEGRVAILELDLSVLLNELPKPQQARALNRLPSSDLDLAFVLPDSVPAVDLHRVLRQATGKRLVSLELFDTYRGAGVPEGSRSLAFRLRLQDEKSSVSDEMVAAVREACSKAAASLGAELRG